MNAFTSTTTSGVGMDDWESWEDIVLPTIAPVAPIPPTPILIVGTKKQPQQLPPIIVASSVSASASASASLNEDWGRTDGLALRKYYDPAIIAETIVRLSTHIDVKKFKPSKNTSSIPHFHPMWRDVRVKGEKLDTLIWKEMNIQTTYNGRDNIAILERAITMLKQNNETTLKLIQELHK